MLIATILGKFSKSKYWKGAINGNKPIVVALISSTVILLMVKTFFFDGSLNNPFKLDLTSITLFVILILIYYLYKLIRKKKINTIVLLLISAALGIIMF